MIKLKSKLSLSQIQYIDNKMSNYLEREKNLGNSI